VRVDQSTETHVIGRRHSRSSAGSGLALILLGLVLFAWTQGMFSFDLHGIWPGINWGLVWPVFILLPGIVQLLRAPTVTEPQERARLLEGGAIMVVLALFFFAAAASLIPWSGLWPLFLVLGGALLLMRQGGLSRRG
jgi:hypothetical protein